MSVPLTIIGAQVVTPRRLSILAISRPVMGEALIGIKNVCDAPLAQFWTMAAIGVQ